MACQRCTSKTAPTGDVTISKPGTPSRAAVAITQELCGPCRTITAAVFPVEGGLLSAEEPEEEDEGDGGEWVHKGGGYYENTVTGDTQRGRPESEGETVEDEEEDEGDEAEA
jgi:hypothetical protein